MEGSALKKIPRCLKSRGIKDTNQSKIRSDRGGGDNRMIRFVGGLEGFLGPGEFCWV